MRLELGAATRNQFGHTLSRRELSEKIQRNRILRLREIIKALNVSGEGEEEYLWKIIAETIHKNYSLRNLWMIVYVWTGQLPTRELLEFNLDFYEENGPVIWLQRISEQTLHNLDKSFRIESNSFFVDVFHTSQTELATGIQRVTRKTVSNWATTENPVLLTWDTEGIYFRTLTSTEFTNATELEVPGGMAESAKDLPILVPLGSHIFFPELTAEPWRTNRLVAYILATGIKTGAIGYDCVPITSAETTSPGMPVVFSNYLDLLAHTNKVAAISSAAEMEFSGWHQMLSAKGILGPTVKEIFLASSAAKPSAETINEVLLSLGIERSIPLIVSVGSHEPRKNHLSVLRSAEYLWNQGINFTLLFIGGNSWKSGYFKARIIHLQNHGHPLVAVSAANDQTLLSAIAGSHFTVFPSLNEGFGLPVAESLELGVPVITSNFGSTREIAESVGGILINPKSDEELKISMKKLLTDTKYLEMYKAQASLYKSKTWSTYSKEVWQFFKS